MCRPSSLVFVALCLTSVYCKPVEPDNEQPEALIGNPKFMAAFLEFLQNHIAAVAPTAAPPKVEPEVTVLVSEPSVTITGTAQNPPTVDSRAPFPGLVLEPQPTFTLPNNPVQFEPNSQVNSSVQQWGNVRIVTHPRIYIGEPVLLTPEQQRKQAINAKYQFSTYEDDNIKGSFLTRAEVRDGLKVHGQYGYDDGFINKMVYYVADEQGYRIVKEETKPSTKTGKLDGTARVQIIQDNTQVDYNIASKDIGTTVLQH